MVKDEEIEDDLQSKEIEAILQPIAEKLNVITNESSGLKEQTKKKEVVLFFSFDIVNSTAYKTINYYGWAQVLNLLFKALRENVQNQIKGAEMWRVLGDEAIFVVKIRDDDELREYVNRIFIIMISTISKLKSGEFFKFDDNFNLMKLQNILSLKTAAWVAVVNDVGDISDKEIYVEEVENIFERYQSQEGYEIFEFLGNDIDTGFRIATQSRDGRMVLSFELAYLISQRTESCSYLHIITYKRLKGVWKEKLYPVIWYHNPKAYLEYYKKEVQFEESFVFDDYIECDLVREYYNNRDKHGSEREIRDSRMYIDSAFALNKILNDRNLSEKVEYLQQKIKEATHDQTRYIDMEKLQIHCVAVCYKKESDGKVKVLIAKRQNKREKLGGKWEFGCAKALINKSIAQRIKEEYEQDFGIEIEPLLDSTRKDREPIPIALYQVNHGNRSRNIDKMDKGIITLAKITKEYDINEFIPSEKHTEVRWITESELAQIENDLIDMVPDFKRTLEQAFELINKIEH